MSEHGFAPFLARLKDETREQHVALEDNPLMKRVFAPDVTLRDYVVLLKEYDLFVRPLEERAFAFIEWSQRNWCYPPRPRAGLLQDDLRAIGEKAPVLNDEVDSYLPPIETFAEALGCVYVLEGAAHGAAILSRRLQERLKLTPERGLSYYNRYGKNLGPFWQEFRGVLHEVSSHGHNATQVIDSARMTFKQLDRWLKRPQVGGESR